MSILQHKFLYILALVLAFMANTKAIHAQTATASVFAHYKGVNNLDYINGMQQVHEYEYTYYVTPGMTIELPLPFEGYNSSANKNDEPRATTVDCFHGKQAQLMSQPDLTILRLV